MDSTYWDAVIRRKLARNSRLRICERLASVPAARRSQIRTRELRASFLRITAPQYFYWKLTTAPPRPLPPPLLYFPIIYPRPRRIFLQRNGMKFLFGIVCQTNMI